MGPRSKGPETNSPSASPKASSPAVGTLVHGREGHELPASADISALPPPLAPPGSRRWWRFFGVGLAFQATAIAVLFVTMVVGAVMTDAFTQGVASLFVLGVVGLPLFGIGVLLEIIAVVGGTVARALRSRREGSIQPVPP